MLGFAPSPLAGEGWGEGEVSLEQELVPASPPSPQPLPRQGGGVSSFSMHNKKAPQGSGALLRCDALFYFDKRAIPIAFMMYFS